MFNTEFDELASEKSTIDLYPKELQAQIDEINTWVYDTGKGQTYKYY
jgi:putative glutathione S-transferase